MEVRNNECVFSDANGNHEVSVQRSSPLDGGPGSMVCLVVTDIEGKEESVLLLDADEALDLSKAIRDKAYEAIGYDTSLPRPKK